MFLIEKFIIYMNDIMVKKTIFKEEEQNNNLYDLANKQNYKNIICDEILTLFLTFSKLIHNYILHSFENMNNKNKVIFAKGINMMEHIFIILYSYTKNLELTAYYCKNSIVYYVEYISQITDKDDNMFFNLSLKDAVIYVYTKTIYGISQDIRVNVKFMPSEKKFLNKLSNSMKNYISIIKIITCNNDFYKIDNEEREKILNKINENMIKNAERDMIINNNSLSPRLMHNLENISDKLDNNEMSIYEKIEKLCDLLLI
tara:strand:- start:1492 stop:2265 length:774 start_codon:yes stop_codon:yes gene_type:complete